ncbi:MAG: peptidylprolyl isomerase [Alphaproteobacteria bacterium]|nr:peptidylprolyl isomerase [Alphaproteobacteria bacterium]
MKKTFIRFIAVLVLIVAAFVGYKYLTQPTLEAVPPIPPAPTESSATSAPKAAKVGGDSGAAASNATATAAKSGDPAVVPKGNILRIEVAGANSGVIEIKLRPDLAPNHVARIKALATAGKYDNVIFHRVIDGFMAQTGDIRFGIKGGNNQNAGMGSSDLPNLKAEFSQEKFTKGVVGMARGSSPDSANSQFFIMFADAPGLNGQYTIIGNVISGQDVVDAIKKGDSSRNGSVVEPDYMKSVRIE